MSSSTLSLSLACLDAPSIALSAARTDVSATGYFFYGYWFSHKRA
ncbi:hypothetical protein WG219_21400 [Ectopseudomonas mendocina]|uniref:Uncharacterized protein n=1 Tax=Ectopseudomonas mendocina TaxID=300 RepID=A0ABZ2RFK9_ECTME